MACDWCGKKTSSSGFCSNKCLAEHDSHHGISPDQRREENKRNSRGGCYILVIFFVVLGMAQCANHPDREKTTSSGSSRPSSSYKQSYGTYANKKDDSWVCKYCRSVPSQTDGLTCYKAKDPYLHVWLKR